MKVFFALVVREISERKALLAAAAVASLLPLLAPLLPSTGTNPPEDIREAVMWVILGGLAPLFALLLGVSFIGRDLSEGRMGFYYSQPISGPMIWFGKLTAVILLVWAVEIIIMLPTVLLAPDPLYFLFLPNVLNDFIPKWLAPTVIFLTSVFVVLLAHAVGTIWRARSLWLIVDLVAFLVAAGCGWMAIGSIAPIVAPRIAEVSVYWILVWTMVGLIVAGALQVSAGRVDLRRNHRFLTTTLWPVIIVGVTGLLGWTLWVRSAQLGDLKSVYSFSVGSGEWVAVSGISPGRFDYYPRFLMNVTDGRSVDIGPATNWFGPELDFSADGSRAVWPEIQGFDHWVLMSVDLDANEPNPVTTGVTVGGRWEDLAISTQGDRFAVLEGRTLAVYGLGEGEQLTAMQFNADVNPLWVSFDDHQSIRILATTRQDGSGGDTRWWLYWFSVDERSLSTPIEIKGPWRWRQRTRDGMADNPLVWTRTEDGERVLAIQDRTTGDTIRDLGPAASWSDLRLMRDEQIVVIRDRDDEHHLEVFEPDGVLRFRIDLPFAEEIYHGGEVASNQILVGLWTWKGEPPERHAELQTVLIDLNDGTSEEFLTGYAPVLGRWGIWRRSRGAWNVGSTAGRMIRGEDGSLHLWDPETNELKQLIPVPD
jgi:hypothetical protein